MFMNTAPRVAPRALSEKRKRSANGNLAFKSISQLRLAEQIGSRSPGRGNRAISGTAGAETLWK